MSLLPSDLSTSCTLVPYYNKEFQLLLFSQMVNIQGSFDTGFYYVNFGGGAFLWVCEELTSLGPLLQSACNITSQN